MKTIFEYLSTKVKNVKSEFPTTQSYNDIVLFLKKQGFAKHEIKLGIHDNLGSILNEINKISKDSKDPIFFVEHGNTSWIRFCRKGNIDINNPVVFLYTFENIPDNWSSSVGFIEYTSKHDGSKINMKDVHCQNIKTAEDLQAFLNENFGW